MYLLFLIATFILCTFELAAPSPYIVSGDYNAAISGMTRPKWRKYCEVDDDGEWFERNEAAFACTGNFSAFLGVFVKLTGASSDRNLTFVADVPYTINTFYNETGCKFIFVLKWWVVCDSILCPLLPPGLYLAVQETYNKIDVDAPLMDDESRYKQGYTTGVIPGNPDQTTWTDYHISMKNNWFFGGYKDVTGNVSYEELISVKTQHAHKHVRHSAQAYKQCAQYDCQFEYMDPWIDLDYYDNTNGVLPEPYLSVHNAYVNTPESIKKEYAPGKFSHMVLIVPFTGKREVSSNPYAIPQSQYDSYMTQALEAKNRGIFPPKLGF